MTGDISQKGIISTDLFIYSFVINICLASAFINSGSLLLRLLSIIVALIQKVYFGLGPLYLKS